MRSTVPVFVYGSLLNIASLKKSVPDFSHYFSATLPGYKRVFDYASPYRKDVVTQKPSSVLNLVKDAKNATNGICFILDKRKLDDLFTREEGYEFVLVTIIDERGAHHDAHTFIVRTYEPSVIQRNSTAQDEYIAICVEGARNYGDAFYQEFIDTTYVDTRTLREYLLEKQ